MRNLTVNILSYGESISRYIGHMPTDKTAEFSIGVNDVARFVPADNILILDYPKDFTEERKQRIEFHKPTGNYFILRTEWTDILVKNKCCPISLFYERSNLTNLFNRAIFSKLPYSYNSPFVAACLAIRLGAKTINLFGVDFNTDSSVNEHFHAKNLTDFQNLSNVAGTAGIKIYTTPESKLSKFIPINPKL